MDIRMGWRSFTIGIISGQRSMLGPAVARWRAHDPLRLAFAALAVGELIADKLPATPPRTSPPALVFRILAGGFAGRSVAVSFAADSLTGTLAGAVGAMLGAYGGMALRGQIVGVTGVPDPIVALIEDAFAVSGALAATRP